MGSRALLGASSGAVPPKLCSFLTLRRACPYLPQLRNLSARSALQPPDVPRLAEAARISLKPEEIEDFAPKIGQVIDWFGQLQAVNLDGIEPTLRADTEVGDNLRPDSPVTFENREAILAAVPNYLEPYIKVPKILNKE